VFETKKYLVGYSYSHAAHLSLLYISYTVNCLSISIRTICHINLPAINQANDTAVRLKVERKQVHQYQGDLLE